MARKDADSSGFSTRVVAAPPVFPSAQAELDASLLTDLARCFWAKSGDGESTWLSVVQHLMDTADIAGYLFDEYWLFAFEGVGVVGGVGRVVAG